MPEQRSLSATMQEFYIRKEGDEDSRGPFTMEQLASLIEAGQVDRQTYYYDSLAEKWVEIQSNSELVTTLFPVKKKLSMRPRESVETVNLKPARDEKPITVEDMLAAAEGQTSETRGKRDKTKSRERAAHWGMRTLAAMFVVSAAGLLVNNMAKIGELEFFALVTTPEIVFGVLDLLLAVLLFLEMTTVYALVRVRAAIGLGFFAVYFGVLPDQKAAMAAVVVGSVAAFLLTLTAEWWAVVVFGILGLAGMGGFAYVLLN